MFFIFLAAQAAVVTPSVSAAAPAAEATAPTSLRLPALTNVRIGILADLASKQNSSGDEFDIALIAPIAVADGLVVPAGTRGRGWVIHADKARFGGKPGELLLGARHLKLGDIEIPLRSMKLAIRPGKDNGTLAMGMAVAGGAIGGVASMFVTGGQQRVAIGMEATAKTAVDVELPLALLARDNRQPIAVQPAAAAPTDNPESTEGEGDLK